ncbi:MAG: zinc-ribbon domain containing protein [Clostridia bacterium]|nr:zinc-ribbon domain containing protein [Clostridia bacterium]
MYQDKTLVCKDCGQEFVFTAGEQEFYAEKGFQNEPKCCKPCRIARKNSRPANGEAQQQEMYETTCAQCGGVARVRFIPKNERPILCSECYAASRANRY